MGVLAWVVAVRAATRPVETVEPLRALQPRQLLADDVDDRHRNIEQASRQAGDAVEALFRGCPSKPTRRTAAMRCVSFGAYAASGIRRPSKIAPVRASQNHHGTPVR
ncbi:hypothetical protein BST30_02305 [Mycobacterium mantenii]|uniref:Uncharacterized protein n=1 Tax=Mycobacterium mantenii TaxID=560555 RepID=A0A1X0G451_MYCNT|nr:hypothetical protein BST30_02305 [Mycobacterium mantenii]